jgi:predicted permease
MFFKRKQKDDDLAEEIAGHLRMAEQDFGKEAALRGFGNVGLVTEVTREMWGWAGLERFWQDVRYALRVLRKNPGYTLTAVLSLALGIGANTAIFSLIDAIMLQSLPVKNPQELVSLGDPTAVQSVSIGSGGNVRLFSYPFYKRFRQQNGVFTDLYASGRSERIDLKDEAEHPHGRFVSDNYFSVLGVEALQGRTFVPDDRESVVISYDFWQRHFQGASTVVGQKLTINHRDFSIVGVAPRHFYGDIVGFETDVWFPIEAQPEADPGRDYRNSKNTYWLQLMGRLKPGVSVAQVSTVVNTVGIGIIKEQSMAGSRPDELKKMDKEVVAVQSGAAGFSRIRHSYSQPLKILMSLVGLVLLICCANVANLQMARAVSRSREIGLRFAIGAGRTRLLRQLLTESMVLAAAGGFAALFCAYWMSRLLLHVTAGSGRLPLEPNLSATALLFTAAVSVVAVLVFGLAPALFATSGDVALQLRESKTGRSKGSAQRFEKALVVLQITLSLVLLYGSGLFIRTLRNLEQSDVGYRRTNLLIAETDPLAAGYKDLRIVQLATNLTASLSSIPGVSSASFSENGMFNGTESASTVAVEGFVNQSPDDNLNQADKVGPKYFSTLGVPVLAGREIDERDTANAAKVVVINQAMARFYFKSREAEAVGRHITDSDGKNPRTIVGVVGDAKQGYLRNPAARRFYTPYVQSQPDDSPGSLRLEIRTQGGNDNFQTAVSQAIHRVDPNLREPAVKWAQALIEDDIREERMIAQLSGFFSTLALILAAVGLYGVMSYLTERRTTEVGVRMALGATKTSVVGLILRETLSMSAVGLVVGVGCAFAIGKLTAGSLYGVAAFDPLTIVAATAIICVAALVAGWFPAHRAARVDPMVALRAQ